MDRENARKIAESKKPLTDAFKLHLLNDEVVVLNGLGNFDPRFKEMLKDDRTKLALATKLHKLSPEEKVIFYGLDKAYQLYDVLAPELKPVQKQYVTGVPNQAKSDGKGKPRVCKKCGLPKRM